jgi:CRISPR-associated endonuclease/helicase Cas3
LFERVQNVFVKHEVGLIHSNAKLYLEKKYEKENGVVDEYFKNEFLFVKNFSRPVTVATLDALLKNFINISRFNVISANFLSSVVIIDEVHSYDFKLLGFLKRFLELCDEFGVKVCLMSASIPNAIKDLLNINRYKLISQESLFEKKANNITKKEIFIEDDIEKIIDAYKKGKKVLVIKNTIKGATEIFKVLKKKCENSMLYHSTFKKIDRNKKEEMIFEMLNQEGGFLLVATQVVEISLDIDFEIMFSDVAPIDSLIQRFGRVNRKKQEDKKGEIFIYKVRSAKPYRNEIVDLSFDVIKNGYFELKEYNIWLNTVYDELFKSKTVKNEINRLFDESYHKYDITIKKLLGIYKSRDNYDLRDIDVPKIDFLLYEDYIKGKIDYENTISLPFYYEQYEHKIPEYRDDVYYKVLNDNVEYSFERGINLNEKENFDFV